MAVADDSDVPSLVERAKAFDPDAWDALYRRAWPVLFSYVRRRLSNDDAAHDAVSETMTRAIDRITKFTWKGAGFDAWLYGIARNVVHEQHRLAWRTGPDVGAPEAVPSAGASAIDGLIAAEEASMVRAAFARLDPSEQEVLELRVVEGLSADGVAEIQGRRPGAVRMAQSRALARLRSMLAEEGADV